MILSLILIIIIFVIIIFLISTPLFYLFIYVGRPTGRRLPAWHVTRNEYIFFLSEN